MAMTNRERMLGVIRGREIDRVPFVQYDGLAAPNGTVWEVVARENFGVLRWSSVHRLERPHCDFTSAPFEKNGRRGVVNTMTTLYGELREVKLFEPVYNSAATLEHFVKTPDDYRILLAFLRDTAVVENVAQYLKDDREVGDDGLPMVAMDRTPFQQLWVQWVCLEELCLHLADYDPLLLQCIDELKRIHFDTYEIVYKAVKTYGIPFVDVPDNITAPAIGVKYFQQYCVPMYARLAEMLDDVPVFVHMDGDLQPLADAIAHSGVGGLDSFSPQPDNDTRVADAVAQWPGMRLFLNFPSSVHLGTPDEIYAAAMTILREGGHTGRLQIQISENVPPDTWRTSFPAIVQAIADFGKP
jgi:hypothetical protein